VPVAGILLVLDMLGAYQFVHAGHGIFIQNGGAELVIALSAASLLLAAVGAGTCSFSGRPTASPQVCRRA
jgi:putative oxidoreductase